MFCRGTARNWHYMLKAEARLMECVESIPRHNQGFLCCSAMLWHLICITGMLELFHDGFCGGIYTAYYLHVPLRPDRDPLLGRYAHYCTTQMHRSKIHKPTPG